MALTYPQRRTPEPEENPCTGKSQSSPSRALPAPHPPQISEPPL
nr:MAG TPA_asm: hypothetical protein [Caudoviricetes sp.]